MRISWISLLMVAAAVGRSTAFDAERPPELLDPKTAPKNLMPLRPKDGETVAQNPPDLSWPPQAVRQGLFAGAVQTSVTSLAARKYGSRTCG